MFESVLLPAPFSPSSACTSPSAASNSTPSFATTAGNRFVIPWRVTAGIGVAPARRSRSSPGACALTLGAAFDPSDEPVHRVELLHGQALALLHAELAALVVQRDLEIVERHAPDRLRLRGDRLLRRRADLRPERCELREAVVHVPVVEAALPRPGHGGLHA